MSDLESLDFVQARDHQHKVPDLVAEVNTRSAQIVQQPGGIAVRYSCHCGALVEKSLGAIGATYLVAAVDTQKFPIAEERFSDPHLEFGLPGQED